MDVLYRIETAPGDTKVDVTVVRFEEMSMVEQIGMAYDADIILGIHGMGLTHSIWTRSGATVVEIFPTGSFLPDCQLMTMALQHNHIAVWNDSIYPTFKEQWETSPGDPKAWQLHDGTRVILDTRFFGELLEQIIEDMT